MKRCMKVLAYTSVVALISSSATAHYYSFKAKNKPVLDLFSSLKSLSSEDASAKRYPSKNKSAGSAMSDFLKALEEEFSKEESL